MRASIMHSEPLKLPYPHSDRDDKVFSTTFAPRCRSTSVPSPIAPPLVNRTPRACSSIPQTHLLPNRRVRLLPQVHPLLHPHRRRRLALRPSPLPHRFHLRRSFQPPLPRLPRSRYDVDRFGYFFVLVFGDKYDEFIGEYESTSK